jgi:gamma-glutamyltranspeptidase/glutathione hydrolase
MVASPFLRKISTVMAGALALALAGAAHAAPVHSRPQLTAGAVAAPDRYGAQAAADVLRAGGNAVDAAVATGFALAVTYPEAGNLGGGGFMTLYVHGKPYFLDYREKAPAKATAAMYLDAKGDIVDGLSLVGNLSAGVPGTVRGLAEAHRRFGKLSWKRDLAPAIRYARDGFVVPQGLVAEHDGNVAPFKDATNFERYFGALKAGQTFRQPELARTLERIADKGPDEFYRGKTADLLVAQMARGPQKGLIDKADLAAYRPVWREPLKASWEGFEVISAPPPSSGGVALMQLLDMKADRADLFGGVALNSPQYIHLVSEIEKRVFADRAEYMGDPDFVKVPVARLMDPAYIARRAREIDPKAPSPTAAVKPGLEKPQTTHYSVIDRWGNAASNTYTLNGSFGAGVVVEGAGFLLNDEMDDFSSKPGTPNQFGVVGGEANAIGPGKRPLSSMSPTLLLKNGHIAMAIGTPGGSRIFTSVFQVLADVYDFHLPLKAAVTQMRFHHQLLPENTVYFEPYAPPSAELTKALAARGYKTEDQGYNGDIETVQVLGGGKIVAEPDPRGRGVGMVVR